MPGPRVGSVDRRRTCSKGFLRVPASPVPREPTGAGSVSTLAPASPRACVGTGKAARAGEGTPEASGTALSRPQQTQLEKARGE